MVAMDGQTKMETSTRDRGKGGLMKGLKRMLAGESFFMNHYTAPANGGRLMLATALPGDMMVKTLQNETILVQAGSFVAKEDSIEMDTSWQGFKNIFAKESMFWVKLSGTGKVVLSSFGAIYEIEVEDEYIVDTGHIVAFQEGMQYKIAKANKSFISSILGGEGLVTRFIGRGKVWCQSHHPTSFGKSVGPKLKPR